MENIIEKHICNTQKNLKKYNNFILKSKYDKDVSDSLIQTYIDARYYNFGVDSKIKVFHKRIYTALKEKAIELIKEEPRKKEIIENTLSLFQYYFYFDYVRDCISLEEIVNSISEMRILKLGLRSAVKDNFKEDFLELLKTNSLRIDELIEQYDSNDFNLDIRKIDSKVTNYYNVKLKYNFSFPEIFSKDVVEDVFNSDIVAEDKLFVEYPMIALKVFLEILSGNFSKVYICDFSVDLLNKKKKLEQVLTIINNQASQEKIYFRVNYKEFKDNKTEIFKLIKKGFCFALETNDEMPKLSNEELKILEIFNCIITSSNDINKKKYKNVKILEK